MSIYDVVVVGAGSAGIPLAVRLSDEPDRRVALIEAGPHYKKLDDYPIELRYSGLATPWLPGHPNSWAIPVELTDEGVTQSLPRGRVVGGSSAINGVAFERGLPDDFAEWAAAGNDEWAFDKVLPFFQKMETDLDIRNEWHGASGPVRVRRHTPQEWTPADQAFVAGCKAAGFPEDLDMNAPESYGVGALPMNTIEGVRQNVSLCYLEPVLETRTNLDVLPECLARRVVFQAGRAVGVEVDTAGERKLIHANEVVLSAGAVKSPHILMLSGIGPSAELRRHGIDVVADSPGVGRNVSDHCFGSSISFRVKGLRKLNPTEHPAMHVGLHYTAEGSEFSNDLMSLMAANPHNVSLLHGVSPLRRARMGIQAMKAMSIRRVLEEARLGSALGVNVILMKGNSRGEISLRSADPYDMPRVQYHYLNDAADLRRLRYGTRLMASLITEGEGFRDLGAKILAPARETLISDRALNDEMRRSVVTCIHMAGSCKMGPDSDRDAVVDQHCRVRGVDNLRIVDTSIWPVSPRRSSNATAIMTGERAAALFAG